MKCLIVDDRQNDAYMLRKLIESIKFDVETAGNGEEALQKLQGGRYDLILSDIMMPVMDGFQLCHAVKTSEEFRDIPFIFYTATYTSDKDEAFAFSLGANGFIIKPMPPVQLLQRLHEILNQSQTQPSKRPVLTAADELKYYKEYTTRLVRKLEDKVREVETSNQQLKQLNENLEKRVQEATQDLHQRNKELEAFSHSVSHDLQAPLRAIQGLSTILLSESNEGLSKDQLNYLARIAENARRLQMLIQDLLNFSRLGHEELVLKTVSLESVLDQALLQLDERIKGTLASLSVQNPLPLVRAYEPALVQVIVNLIDNALKFTKPGNQPILHITTQEMEKHVRFSVKDNGIGIDPKYHAKVFEVFERLHGGESYPGTGIGLAIVQRAVQRMGGNIGLISELGQGSCFWIELKKPVSTDPGD